METTKTNRTVSKQTETTPNFLKNTKICTLSNCFGWSSVCFGSINIETLCFGIEVKQSRQTISKQTKTNWKKTKIFCKKYQSMLPNKTVLVGLLFVSVQSKHRNSLFRYRSKTTETNVLFRIVPKLVLVSVSGVVSNEN
jgi:hypothetical protein